MAKSYFTEAEVLKKYGDIVAANQKPGWSSRDDKELVKFQILMQYNPEVSCYLMNYWLIQNSLQIQWVPPYFWEKNISVLERLVQNGNRDAKKTVEKLSRILNDGESTIARKSATELKQRFNQLAEFIKSQPKSFFSKRTSVSYENLNTICCIEAPLPEIARAELYALEESELFGQHYSSINDLFSDTLFSYTNRDPLNLNEDKLKKLISFKFFNEYIINSLNKFPSTGYLLALFPSKVYPSLYTRMLLRMLELAKKRNIQSVMLVWLLLQKRDIIASEVILKLNKKISNKEIDLDFVLDYIFNSNEEYNNKISLTFSGGAVPTFEQNTTIAIEILIPFLNSCNAEQILKYLSYPNLNLKYIMSPQDWEQLNIQLAKLLKTKNKIDTNIERFVRSYSRQQELELFSSEVIGQILRLSLSERHSTFLGHLIRGGEAIWSGQHLSQILDQKQMELAKTLIEEELQRGDASAMNELEALIMNGHHTKKMLNILIYHLGWGSDQAAEVVYNLISRSTYRSRIPQELIDFIYTHISPKGIKDTNEQERRYKLFEKLYPKLLLRKEDRGFTKLSEASKRKIYNVLINNRKFRNGINAQRKLFEGLHNLSELGLLTSIDTLISKKATGSTQITKKLNKLIARIRIIMDSRLFYSKKVEFRAYLEKSRDISEALEQVELAIRNIAHEELSTLSKANIDKLVENDELLRKVLHLNNHYQHNYHSIYMEGVTRFLLGKHDGFKYRDLAYLLKTYGKTTNLTPTTTKKWIKTMNYIRIPQSMKSIDITTIIARIDAIKLSIKARSKSDQKLDTVKKLLEHLEPLLYKLKSRDIEERLKVTTQMKELMTKLKSEKQIDLARILSAIIRDIDSAGSEKYQLTDEFEFNKAHDIGEHWGTCQSWSSTNSLNKGLVATINDGTKKYILVKDPTKNGVWLARGNMHLALRGNEFVLVLDNNSYANNKEQKELIREFAINKAKYMKIPFADSNRQDTHNFTVFGKTPTFYSDTGLARSRQEQII